MFLQIYKILSHFDTNPLICDPTLFSDNKIPNIASSNRVFPGKRRGDRALILTHLVSPIAEIFQEKTGGQRWTKRANVRSVSFL